MEQYKKKKWNGNMKQYTAMEILMLNEYYKNSKSYKNAPRILNT